jgi:hypothetical protein
MLAMFIAFIGYIVLDVTTTNWELPQPPPSQLGRDARNEGDPPSRPRLAERLLLRRPRLRGPPLQHGHRHAAGGELRLGYTQRVHLRIHGPHRPSV